MSPSGLAFPTQNSSPSQSLISKAIAARKDSVKSNPSNGELGQARKPERGTLTVFEAAQIRPGWCGQDTTFVLNQYIAEKEFAECDCSLFYLCCWNYFCAYINHSNIFNGILGRSSSRLKNFWMNFLSTAFVLFYFFTQSVACEPQGLETTKTMITIIARVCLISETISNLSTRFNFAQKTTYWMYWL